MARISKGKSPFNICTRGGEDNIKTYLKETKCDFRIAQNREKD